MIRGPAAGRTTVDFVAKAETAWGAMLPAWVKALAEEANRTNGGAAAARVGYGASTISQVLSKSYRGDLAAVEAKVRGALMGATVACPVLGEIGLDTCKTEQAAPFRATNSTRAHLRRACKTCPNRSAKPTYSPDEEGVAEPRREATGT